MSSSFSVTDAQTYSITHARHIGAKIATDLKRIQRLYGEPSDTLINNLETEAIKLLKAGYLSEVTYGYRRYDRWVEPTLRYTARDLSGLSAADDDPGRIRPGADIVGANFYSYLIYSAAWDLLGNDEQEAFEQSLPLRRTGAPEPSINGYLHNDLTYSSGGRALERATVRSY